MARLDDEDDGDDAPDRRPRRKARKSGMSSGTLILLVAAIGLGVSVFCCVPIMIALLLPAVQQAREAARRTLERENLKRVGLAAHNFHDAYHHFPPMELKEGTVAQSWMTDLLPYVDQAPLYGQINLQASWDDNSNRIAMTTVLPVYLNPSLEKVTDPPTGYALAHLAGNEHLFGPGKRVAISEINDGTSNTLLAGSVAEGLRPWGDPGNVRDPAAGIGPDANQFLRGNTLPRGAHLLMADGSVRFVSDNIAPGVMQGLARPDDGVIPPNF